MTSTKPNGLTPTAAQKVREQFKRYLELFSEAFDELHEAVIKQINLPSQYVPPHHNYPVMSMTDASFPIFHDTGFYRDSGPKDYVGTLRPRTLVGLLGGYARPQHGFPMGTKLASFLREHEIGKRLNLDERPLPELPPSDHNVDHLVGDAVERYMHQYGVDAPVDAKRRDAVIRPLALGTVYRKLDVSFVVPIVLTRFQVKYFRLTETSYIVRMPKKFQLARARTKRWGSGAVGHVAGAATHAFVSNGWSLDEAGGVDDVRTSLGQASPNMQEAADAFFGALRVATGISTGYAQLLWVPRHWALDYFCDLTPVYGVTVRRYPSEYDDYGWSRATEIVTTTQLDEVRRVYQAVTASESEAIRLAINRLNGCLTRTDPADAILDATIGLELLLGDDQNQSLSYKLRLRAAALAILHGDPANPPKEVAAKVKRLYEARSVIVHGRSKKRSKKAAERTDTSHANERLVATDLLRFVLNVLLANPQYLDPAKIDDGLLLRSDTTAT